MPLTCTGLSVRDYMLDMHKLWPAKWGPCTEAEPAQPLATEPFDKYHLYKKWPPTWGASDSPVLDGHRTCATSRTTHCGACRPWSKRFSRPSAPFTPSRHGKDRALLKPPKMEVPVTKKPGWDTTYKAGYGTEYTDNFHWDQFYASQDM